MVKKYNVALTSEERQYLEQFTTTGKHAAYQINHARILLKADRNQSEGSWRDQDIKGALDLSVRTIDWQFTTTDARVRSHRLYPSTNS